MATLSAHIARMLLRLRDASPTRAWHEYEGPHFSANAITKRAGSVYEKLRYTLDYRDENTVRRSAIERMVRRIAVFEAPEVMAHALLTELVRSGYVDNGKLPEAVASEVQAILDCYLTLKQQVEGDTSHIWAHAATEVEQFLFPAPYRDAVFEAMYRGTLDIVEPNDHGMHTEEDFRLQVYIACRRLYVHDTPEELRFALWLALEPEWSGQNRGVSDVMRQIALRYPAHMSKIEALLKSGVHGKLEGRLHNEAIFSAILMDIVRRYGADANTVLGDRDTLTHTVRELLAEKYHAHAELIRRSGTRAIVYILITKVLIGLAIELPYELLVLGALHPVPILVNTLFFPLMLLVMVKTIHFPGEANTEHIIKDFARLVMDGGAREKIRVPVAARTASSRAGFGIFYGGLCLAIFGGIIMSLHAFAWNAASIALFLFFLLVVSYFGLRIRYKSRVWTYYDQDAESAGGLLWYLVTLPITRTGRWVSTRLSSINVFVFFMDFILETPLKLLLGSFDDFVNFTRELRRDTL